MRHRWPGIDEKIGQKIKDNGRDYQAEKDQGSTDGDRK